MPCPGAVPVVQTATFDDLFADLPVVIVSNWSSVTPEFLQSTWAVMQPQRYAQRPASPPKGGRFLSSDDLKIWITRSETVALIAFKW